MARNPSDPIGYGRRHLSAAVGEFGRAVRDDLVDVLGWAVAEGSADPDRTGVFDLS